jgi:hypothetical protein
MRASRFSYLMPDCTSPHEATDDLVDAYVAWRASCVRVRAGYVAWDECADFDRDLAFAAYLAALDCEEHAAHMYARQIEHVREVIHGAGPGVAP